MKREREGNHFRERHQGTRGNRDKERKWLKVSNNSNQAILFYRRTARPCDQTDPYYSHNRQHTHWPSILLLFESYINHERSIYSHNYTNLIKIL